MKMNGKNKILVLLSGLLLVCSPVFAQTKFTVTGTVKDISGAPVIGAVVMSDASDAAVVAPDGSYTINVSAKATNLTASCLGYKSQSQDIAKRGVIQFVLELDSEVLEETVVVVSFFCKGFKASRMTWRVFSMSVPYFTPTGIFSIS